MPPPHTTVHHVIPYIFRPALGGSKHIRLFQPAVLAIHARIARIPLAKAQHIFEALAQHGAVVMHNRNPQLHYG
jgi:hypothetical protein